MCQADGNRLVLVRVAQNIDMGSIMYHAMAMLALVGFFFTTPADAVNWTAAEISAMPSYCAGRYVRTTNHAEYKRWEAQYGPDFLHTHHLCDGIGLLNKYIGVTDKVQKREMMKSIMGNLNYMIQNADQGFKLMPDVYYYRSQAYRLAGKTGEAISDLRKAIDLNPGYVQGYSLLADYLQRQRQQEEALRVVTEGLRHRPDSASLLRLYTTLGGDPKELESGKQPSVSSSVDVSPPVADKQAEAKPKRAVFDFGRPMYTGGNALREAGAYVFVEFRQPPSGENNRVIMTVASQIPQPSARVVGIGMDMGAYRGMLTSMKILNPEQAKYYIITMGAEADGHSFWPNFKPMYSIKFTRARNEKKYDLYDPRAIPPGSSLGMELTLASGYQIEDLVEAVKRGLRGSDGIRIAIIANHTKGYRPDPRVTIMDDGGYVTASLRQQSGFENMDSATRGTAAGNGQQTASRGVAKEDNPNAADSASSSHSVPQVSDSTVGSSTAGPTNAAPVTGSPTNPWCRFCPETSK